MTTIGIDLGTSKAVVAAVVDGRRRVLLNQEGSRATPAIVARTAGGWVAGRPAKRLAILHPESSVWDFVRVLGKSADSPEARNLSSLVPFEIVESAGGRAAFRLQGEELDPVVLVGVLLAKLKAAAEGELSTPVTEVVVGVSPAFDARQRTLLRGAARMAGLTVLRVVASTSVAALAEETGETAPERFGIVDVGGGGFRVSILHREAGTTRVLATEWEPFVGGEDFDQLLVRAWVEDLRREEGLDAASDPMVLAYLKEAAERAKCRLSVRDQVDVDLPLGASRLWSVTRRREELEALVAPQLGWLAAPCARALRASGTKPGELHRVLNVGGLTRMPLVLETLHESLGQEITPSLHPDEAPAIGAAVLADRLAGSSAEEVYQDVLHHSVGVEAPPRRFASIAVRGASLPLEQSRRFTTSDSRLELTILEGDSEDARDDLFLGKLVYETPFRKSAIQVEVIVRVDSGGEIEVASLDVESGAIRKVPLRAAGLGEREIERAGAEVERYRGDLLSARLSRAPAERGGAELTPAEKVIAALHGDAGTRRRLVRDPDRAVWSAVLENPKMAVDEVRTMAASDVDGEVLRELGADPGWSEDYGVVRALVGNPRTPVETAMRLVDRIDAPDLAVLAADERLAAVVRDQCSVLLKMRS